VFNGSYWEADNKGIVHSLLDKVIVNMKKEKIIAPPEVDPEKIEESWAKFVKRARNNSTKIAVLKEMQHRVPVMPDEFDKDKTLLNTSNGYIDLASGQLLNHSISKMFSQEASVEYSDTVDAPEWNQFLNQIFAGDKELIDYMQKAVGYSMTGSTKEQVMFILFGNGRNGKSIFVETISDVLGSYAKTIQASSIMVKQNSSGPNSDIARLKGARLVTSSEPNEGLRMDEGLVKQLTGGDKVTARKLYGQEFEFSPQFKLWLATNHKPIIRGTDDGIWRRLILIPFAVQIPDSKVDKDLKYKLKREAIGIMNWAVDGCLKWQREGLKTPKAISDASHGYRAEMDVISQFISERCDTGPDSGVKASEVYKAYKLWADENSEHIMSNTNFGKEMQQKFKRKHTMNGNFYQGLSLKLDSRLNFMKG
jgi:putative DNA primase/helicase